MIGQHYSGCNADYPEKAATEEEVQALQHMELDDGTDEWIDICVDCGAIIDTNSQEVRDAHS